MRPVNPSTSIVRYVTLYVMLHALKRGTIAFSDTHRLWHIADRDVKRDWGW